jgi:hypothetical protein
VSFLGEGVVGYAEGGVGPERAGEGFVWAYVLEREGRSVRIFVDRCRREVKDTHGYTRL